MAAIIISNIFTLAAYTVCVAIALCVVTGIIFWVVDMYEQGNFLALILTGIAIIILIVAPVLAYLGIRLSL